ncbi:MAG: efflux RND transporter permease subunit [Spirochaetota bacterium]|nr:efflux RND transporter permease subunit [Spirochaetota bacterium]
MKVVDFSIKRPVTTLMITLIVIILGAFSFTRLAVDLMPDISFPVVTIQTDYEGVSPQEIETLVTRPIEEVAATIQNMDRIISNSYEGRSVVRVFFKWGQNLDEVSNDLRAKLDRTKELLPLDAKPPILLKFDMNAIPIMWIGVSDYSEIESTVSKKVKLRLFAEKILKNRFERIEGVAQAQVTGGLEREIHINLRYHELQAKNVSIKDVVSALKAENIDIPVGDIDVKTNKYILRAVGKFKSTNEINDVVIKRINGVSVTVKDLADVDDSYKDIKSFTRVNGEDALLITITKQADANTVQTADRIRIETENLLKEQGIKDMGVNIRIIRDTSKFIKRSMSNVQESAMYGGVIAVFVLLFFLRNIRSTLIISASIIISIVATFIFIKGAHFTLNMMSFGGLALGIGMLVDNSIVVLENVFRHRIDTHSSIEASQKGTMEVSNAIVVSTLTTVVVFLPLFFLEGVIGIMFNQLAFMVSFSLMCSLMVALTIIPAFTSRFLHLFEMQHKTKYIRILETFIKNILESLEKNYTGLLKKVLNHKKFTISLFAIIFIFSLFLTSLIGFDFMPDTDEGEIRINGDLPVGTNVKTTDIKFKDIEKELKKIKEIDIIYTRIGESGWRTLQQNAGSIEIYLKDFKERKRSDKQIVKEIQKRLSKIKGIELRVRESSFFLFRYMRGGDDRITLEILGHDFKKGDEITNEIIKRLRKIKGITYLRPSREYGNPEYAISIDRRKTKEMGLSVSQVGSYLQSAILGEVASRFSDGEYEYDIRVQIKKEDIKDIESIKNLSFPTENKDRIPFKSLMSVKKTIGPMVVERLNQQRVIYIQGGIGNRDTKSILDDIKNSLSTLKLPERFYINYGGIFEEQGKAYSELIIGIILSICLVYMVMAAQFESFKAPFVIMFTIPISFVGVILIFFITKTSFDIQGFIGSIMLTGIVVNNSIILVEFIQQLSKNPNVVLEDVVVEAGSKRLRPILMTTLTTTLALIPLAIGIGEGSEMQIPLALAVIGGLSFSTLVSLLLIPCIYILFFKKKEKSS